MDGLSIDIFLNKWKNLFYSHDINRSSYSKIHLEKLFNVKFTIYEYNLLKYFFDKKLVHFFNNNILLEKVNDLSIPIDANRLVFIDGCFIPVLSDVKFIKFKNLSSYNFSNHLPDIVSDIFLHLIESSIYKVFVFSIDPKKFNYKPIYLLNISTGLNSNINVVNYRYHMIIESISSVDVIEHYISINNYIHLTCVRFVLEVLNGSCLNHIKVLLENSSSYHFSYSDIYIDSYSHVNSSIFFLNSNVIVSNTNVKLNNEKGNVSLNSLSIPIKNNVFNNYTYIEHNFSNSKSYQLHKIISSAYGKFNGLIKISKDSPKVEAEMLSKNLLLNSNGYVCTDPKLKIYSNDVKCRHSATIGKIDKDQIFYLCSRGIDREIACSMIISAFSYDIINLIKDKVIRDKILKYVNKRCFGDYYGAFDY